MSSDPPYRCTIRRFAAPGVVVVGLALAACGGGNGSERTKVSAIPATTTTSVPVTTTVAAGDGTTIPAGAARAPGAAAPSGPASGSGSESAPDDTDVLKRRDAPPDGVPGQFAFVSGGADESCDGFEHSPRGVYVDDFFLAGTFGADRPELGTYFEICFPGFVLRQALRVEVRPPGRSAQMFTASEFGAAGIVFLGWTSFPGDPLGTYEVTAVQGALHTSGSFTVSPASRPRVVVDPPARSPEAPPPPPGTPFLVYVTGFPPGADAPLYLYRLEPDEAGGTQGQMRYVTTISVPMDAHGQGIHSLATTPDDPPGMYCFVVRAPGREPNYENECSGWGVNDFYLGA